MKRYYLYFAFLFAAIFITFSLANIASALSIKKWNYHVKDNDFGTMNTAVNIYNAAHGTDFKNIVEEYWDSNKTEVEGDYKIGFPYKAIYKKGKYTIIQIPSKNLEIKNVRKSK